jgi:hypothetical protein
MIEKIKTSSTEMKALENEEKVKVQQNIYYFLVE